MSDRQTICSLFQVRLCALIMTYSRTLLRATFDVILLQSSSICWQQKFVPSWQSNPWPFNPEPLPLPPNPSCNPVSRSFYFYFARWYLVRAPFSFHILKILRKIFLRKWSKSIHEKFWWESASIFKKALTHFTVFYSRILMQ